MSGGSYTTLAVPGANNTLPLGINDAGQVVGVYDFPFNEHGFLLSDGSYTTLDPPGSTFSQARGINDKGQIVGNYVDSSGGFHSFLYNDGSYTTFDVPGSTRTEVNGINDAGQIVGEYGNSSGLYAFLATPVPEPSTLLLLDIGTVGLVGWKWRHRKQAM